MNATYLPVFSVPAVPLAVGGVVLVFLAAWLNAVDISISHMSLAYAEEMRRDGRRGAPRLVEAVEGRKWAPANLTALRSIVQTLGLVSFVLSVGVVVARFGWPWWAVFALVLAAAWVVQLLALAFTLRLIRGARYERVALLGARFAVWTYRFPALPQTSTEGQPDHGAQTSVSEARLEVMDSLRELVDQVQSLGGVGALPEEDQQIIRSVFQLGTTRVGELMVPRGEMVTVRAEANLEEALKLFVDSGFSRVPVVGKNLDDLVGVLYLKDVVQRSVETRDHLDLSAEAMARPAAFIPEMKLADEELRDMQATNNHIALVVDEYGGIAGLVTAEDVLEELVGELVDEHDHKGSVPVEVSPGVWQVPTSMAIDDLAGLLECRIDEDDIYSVGGLLTKATGKVLLPGASAQVGCVHLEAGASVGRRRKVLTVYAQKTERPAGDEDTTRAGEPA